MAKTNMHFVSATLLFILSSASAQTYNSSFTQYGADDKNGSPNCNSAADNSCGFYNYPGYNAAVSQNLFGASSGVGSACGECYRLTPTAEYNGDPIEGASPIVVRVNNLCPATSENPLCQQPTLSDTNSLGQNVNFDLCIDDGAAYAFFGNQNEANGIQNAIGTAELVSCDEWSGSPDLTTGSNTYTTGPTPINGPPPPISTITTTTTPPSGQTATLFGSCGAGPTYTGPTICPASATCSTQNQYYAQCVPSTAGGTTLITTTSMLPITTAGPTATQTLFGQCGGGATYVGPTACQPTATCSAQNSYYSQCLPLPSS